MTATLPDVTPRKKPPSSPELEAAKELVRQAREQGLSLTGPDGLLKQSLSMITALLFFSPFQRRIVGGLTGAVKS